MATNQFLDQEKLRRLIELQGQSDRMPAAIQPNYVEDPELVQDVGFEPITNEQIPVPTEPIVQPEPVQEVPQVNPITGIPIVREASQMMQDAFEAEKVALRKGAQAGSVQAAAEASLLEETAKRQQEMVDRNLEQTIQRETQVQEKMKLLDDQIQQLSSKEIDPSRYWKNKSTGEKVIVS